MKGVWYEGAVMRPDRYIDWSVQASFDRRAGDDNWCPVAIQVLQSGKDAPLAHLEWLQAQVRATKSGAATAAMEIRMRSVEELALDTLVERLKGEDIAFKPDDVRLEFFVYLRQADVYDAGNYRSAAHYFIRFAGPPISDLNFLPNTAGAETGLIDDNTLTRKVAIGVIDDAIAFAHQRFRRVSDGRYETNILGLWLQDIEFEDPDKPGQFRFGRQLNLDEINQQLSKAGDGFGGVRDLDVYRATKALDFTVSDRSALARASTHGTHVMDLAVGTAQEEDPIPIFAVQLPVSITADTSGMSLASYALQGLRQIVLWADNSRKDGPTSLVVNFSYGFQGGPKDGTSVLEHEIDRLIGGRSTYVPEGVTTAIVLPSGNSFNDRTSARMTLKAKGDCDASSWVDWMILPDDRTESYLEIWLPRGVCDGRQAPLRLTLTPPGGPASPCELFCDGDLKLFAPAGSTVPVAGIYYDMVPLPSGYDGPCDGPRARFFLALNRTNALETPVAGLEPAEAGRWRITVENELDRQVEVDLYIQRDDTLFGYSPGGRQSYFDHPAAYGRTSQSGDYDLLEENCPIVHERTFSALGGGSEPVLAGAAELGALPRLVEGNEVPDTGPADADFLPVTPSNFSAKGRIPATRGPFASAICDQGPTFPGIYAAGVMSGSMALYSGTSIAAPQIARAIAAENGEPEELAKLENAHREPHSRLGRFVLSEDRSVTAPVNGKRRYKA